LKEEHDNIMHAPTVTGEEMAIVMDCFRQSTKMERVRYEAEKKKNDNIRIHCAQLERNLNLLIEKGRRREEMLKEKDKIIEKLRRNNERQSAQVSTLRKIIQDKDSRISTLEIELDWGPNLETEKR
jgi:predicted RNase H-like nuclease (RuvC/YqgF family)